MALPWCTLSVQLLVALGGGSAIDTAKAASIVLACGGSVEDYEGENKSSKPGLPIVAVNTTAGTGSECTSFYIVTDPVRHSKMAMVDPNCMVSIAVNDTDFMSSMPPKLTAATGMDALTHAIEAALSKNASPITDKDAYWAMTAIVQNLPRAVANGKDEEARTMMAYAENVAGMAFSNAGLGMVHAMAHALGGHYNLPHGVCNAVLLPYVLAFNSRSPVCRQRFVSIAGAMGLPANLGEAHAAEAVIQFVKQLSDSVGIPATLAQLNKVDPSDFGTLADLALRDTCMTTNQLTPHPAGGHCRVHGGLPWVTISTCFLCMKERSRSAAGPLFLFLRFFVSLGALSSFGCSSRFAEDPLKSRFPLLFLGMCSRAGSLPSARAHTAKSRNFSANGRSTKKQTGTEPLAWFRLRPAVCVVAL